MTRRIGHHHETFPYTVMFQRPDGTPGTARIVVVLSDRDGRIVQNLFILDGEGEDPNADLFSTEKEEP